MIQQIWSVLVAPDGLEIPLYIVLLPLRFGSDLYVILCDSGLQGNCHTSEG